MSYQFIFNKIYRIEKDTRKLFLKICLQKTKRLHAKIHLSVKQYLDIVCS